MTAKTTFRMEPGASALGWVARRVPEVGGPAGTFLGAGKSPDEVVEHARLRQTSGDASACAHAVVQPHDAARPIRHALDHLDAERQFNRAATAPGATTREAG